ncbi:MAG: carbohydrate ABC transporter permease [Chloroflexota bacterium]|nr:carbohydrate ABC transporter permease [Chloroflexota bacterium]MDE2946470.1 carbohydrate ABC transporter permease [Chloroflexota bacterium]
MRTDAAAQLKRSNNWRRAKKLIGYAIVYAFMVCLACVFMLPIFWMASTSLKLPQDIFAWPPEWLPSTPQWDNYAEAFSKYPLARYMLNSAILVVANIIGALFSVPIIAYGFARFDFPFKNALFLLMLSTMMVPGHIKLIPLFWLYSRLDMIDTYWPLILPAYFGNPFFIFLMTQFIRTIPRELDDAARIDGAGAWGILYRVIIPLSRPALTVIVVFTFLWVWNDFLEPIIFLRDWDSYPISVGLAFFQGRYSVEWHLFMGATLVSIIPILVVYFFAQRHLIGGLASIGIKG